MQRVLVMGSSGSGKSTFAQRLSAITGLPIVSIDALFWKPGWVESDRDEFRERLEKATRQPFHFSEVSFPSFGAPVPDDPMNSLRPSGNVRSRPFARFDPFLAR